MFEAGAIIWRIQTVGKQVLKQDLNESDQAAKAAGKSLGDTAKQTEELGKKSNESAPKVRGVRQEIAGLSTAGQQAARDVGGALLAIGAGVVAMSTLTVKAAIDWETAWTGVRKTVNGTPEELQAVEDGLRDLTGVLPASHDEIAAVAEAAGQLGVRTKDIVGFTKTMIDLGETTNLTSDEAATSLAQLMNIFRTAPEDVDRLGAAVVALGNDGASTERDIVQMSQRIAGAAKIIGLSEGQTLGLANALASVGIEAEAGGSSVSNIMIDIANAVSQKGDKLLKWAELAGMGADEFAEKYRTAPAEALALVIEGMGRLNETGGDVFATLSELGQTDVRVTRSLLGLAGAGDLLRDSLELGNEAWAENTALQEEAEKRYATTAAQLDMAKNSVVDMAIELGEGLLPMVTAVADGVKAFAGFVGGLPDGVQTAIAVVALFGGGLLVLGGILLLTLPKVAQFHQAVKTLATEMPVATARVQGFAGFMAGPWGLALTAGLAVLSALIDRNVQFAARIEELTSTLDENTGAFTDNTRANVAAKLQKDGVYDAAQRAGIGIDELTDAVMGETDALESVRQKMFDYNATSGTLERITHPLLNDSFILVGNAIDRESGALDGARDAWKNTKEATEDGSDATRDSADAYIEAQREVEGLSQDLDELISILNEANDVGQDAVSANADYRAALEEVDDYIRQAREGVEGYSLSLDTNTATGSRNLDMLSQMADDGAKAAEAQYQLDLRTMSAADATALFHQRLNGSQQAVLDRARDLGATDEQLVFIRDHIAAIPPESYWKLLADTAPAEDAINRFFRTYNGKTVAVNVNATVGRNYADGGVRYMANGDAAPRMSAQQAQIRQGGSWVVWAEDETLGESFIPHAPSKRENAERLMAQTADIFGGLYIPGGAKHFAAGGTTEPPTSLMTTRPAPATQGHAVLTDESIERLAQAIVTALRLREQRGGVTNG